MPTGKHFPCDLVIDGYTSVGAWEQSCQEAFARFVVPEMSLRVLEIGYGLGMASRAIQTFRKPAIHLIIESNAAIAASALTDLAETEGMVFCARWQAVAIILRPESFDSIVFDPDPDIPADDAWGTGEVISWIAPAAKSLRHLLAPRGQLGFIDFTNSLTRAEELKRIAAASRYCVRSAKVDVKPPRECRYARNAFATLISLKTA